MPKTIEVTAYAVQELKDKAKDRAMDWLREGATDHNWYSYILDHRKGELDLLGFRNADIQFSGFWSQGDGACFDASLDLDALTKHLGEKSPKLLKLFRYDVLGNYIEGEIRHTMCANYYSNYHARCVSIDSGFIMDPDRHPILCGLVNALEDEIEDLRRDLCHQIYDELEKECEYLMADEQLIETANVNDFLFDESGRII